MAIPPDPTPPDYAPRPRIANATLHGAGCVTAFFGRSVLQPAYLAIGARCIGQVDIFWQGSSREPCQHASPIRPRFQPIQLWPHPIRTQGPLPAEARFLACRVGPRRLPESEVLWA